MILNRGKLKHLKMPVPLVYRKKGNKFVISYSYTDVAAGVGVQEFKLTTHKNSTTQSYALTTDSSYAYEVAHDVNIAGASFQQGFSQNFDIEFQTPRTIASADMIMNITGYMNGNISTNGHVYLSGSVVRLSGATETTIATFKSDTKDSGGAGTTVERLVALKSTCTQTIFRVGDKLRLKLEVWTKLDTGVCTYGFGCDPAGRTLDSGFGTDARSSLYIPFKINT